MTRAWVGLSMMVAVLAGTGCVERRLTIHTTPEGAVVTLNDEEVGITPTTATFQWYGDYNIRIAKEGFQTLLTHRVLKAPWYDLFPFDFFAQAVYPGRIVDAVEWTFDLEPCVPADRDQLIRNGLKLRQELDEPQSR